MTRHHRSVAVASLSSALLAAWLFRLTSTAGTTYAAIGRALVPSVVVETEKDRRFEVEERLALHKVPAASVALMEGGELVWRAQWSSAERVGADTVFQVASISKPITAIGVLRLVQERGLDMDTDVNAYLKSERWKVDYGAVASHEKVTIRRLLGHQAGLNLDGFRGYSRGKVAPTALAVVSGQGATPALKLTHAPGESFSYSGGGFVLLQLLVEDVSGLPFPDYMRRAVFQPLGMLRSTFDQEPSGDVAVAHDKQGKRREDGWLIYPELAAAGLWSTPSDLAKALIAVQQASEGAEGAILSVEHANAMMTPSPTWGLGFGVRGEGKGRYFFHGGSNPGGYNSLVFYFPHKEVGAAITTNGENGGALVDEIARAISLRYELGMLAPRVVKTVDLNRRALEALAGRYQFREQGQYFVEVSVGPDGLLILHDPNDGMTNTFTPTGALTFVDLTKGADAEFTLDAAGDVGLLKFQGAYTFHKVK